MTDKIINTFQQRRQLEQAIADLAQTNNELELTEAARQIAHNFPLELVLNTLLKHLDTPNSQVRGGLGHLAALLPSEAVTPVLRNAVANRQNSPQARFTALTIAQRFLGVELPTTLTDDIHNSDDVALQSLREAIDEGRRNRHILIEYVTQMQQHDEEIAFMVLQALERIAPVEQVELLRLLGQDSRSRVAKAALGRLERLAATESKALQALYTLQFTLPSELSSQVTRMVRKLQFTGKRYSPVSATGWRALLGPAEPNGSQTVWFIKPPTPPAPGALLSFSLNLGAGLLQFFASDAMDASMLPDPRPIGQLVAVTTDRGASTVLLEVPFDYGRWLVATALPAHYANATNPATQALPPEYTLYNDLLWQFDPPQVEESVQAYFMAAEPGKTPGDNTHLSEYAQQLFAHPVMEQWAVQGRALLLVMQRNSPPAANLPSAEVVTVLLREMAKWPESASLLVALERGLRAQAGWLHFAGSHEQAHHAHVLAAQTPTLPLAQNPVLAQMLTLGLRLTRSP